MPAEQLNLHQDDGGKYIISIRCSPIFYVCPRNKYEYGDHKHPCGEIFLEIERKGSDVHAWTHSSEHSHIQVLFEY